MITFSYTIKDKLGIHARPAGMLAKVAKEYKSDIYIEKGEKRALATKIIAIMGMGIHYGNTVTITVDGEDEAEASEAIKNFMKENL
ncbi:MAG: HPr family phosphocarrier protein [Clostridia bacterium]|nr:HPr family phosphocarrier protein [Clostridia bacterium]